MARSILAARKEGRKLKPLSNTRLFGAADALKIQDALIDIRMASGEDLLGWALIDGGHVAPVMTSDLVDDRTVMGIPSQSVDVRVEPVIVWKEETHIGLRAIDRLMPGALTEDLIASGHGLVTVALGDPVTPTVGLEIKTGRSSQPVLANVDQMREDLLGLLAARHRTVESSHLLISAALVPGAALERGKDSLLIVQAGGQEARCSLRHL